MVLGRPFQVGGAKRIGHPLIAVDHRRQDTVMVGEFEFAVDIFTIFDADGVRKNAHFLLFTVNSVNAGVVVIDDDPVAITIIVITGCPAPGVERRVAKHRRHRAHPAKAKQIQITCFNPPL